MMEIKPNEFAILCYNTLISNCSKLPATSYQMEKLLIINEGYGAWNYLDNGNQGRVLGYLADWGYKTPKYVEDYYKELEEITAIEIRDEEYDQAEGSADYPLGGSLEPYDIEKERELLD